MTQDIAFRARSGWGFLFLQFVILFATVGCFIGMGMSFEQRQAAQGVAFLLLAVLGVISTILFAKGFFTVQPNQSRVLVLFGNYLGTVNDSGFFWANPFASKHLVSKRARNLEGERLKVNDKKGNPIEVATAVVWRVAEPAKSIFDVENCEDYVRVQSEAALRHLANSYPYDHGEDGETTLRHVDEINAALKLELQERLGKAGVSVDEARLTHIAYAPEIANAMLRRQQAEAVIAARQKIVEGAVTMVQMALEGLEKRGVVNLDEERKAAMVSNLLVVLCGESEAQPIVNAGTLHH